MNPNYRALLDKHVVQFQKELKLRYVLPILTRAGLWTVVKHEDMKV